MLKFYYSGAPKKYPDWHCHFLLQFCISHDSSSY